MFRKFSSLSNNLLKFGFINYSMTQLVLGKFRFMFGWVLLFKIFGFIIFHMFYVKAFSQI